ncbi:conserved hypothetical protein [gamma proteobacterium NOR5-3]|nr:conserved hypothetical protein [gamma proteobacterium NOR5-3]
MLPSTKQPTFATAAGVLGLMALLGGGTLLMHLRDKPPDPKVLALAAPHCSDSTATSPAATEPFSIAVQAESATLPEDLEHKIAVGAEAAYAQWREWLGDDALLHSRINIRFVGDDQQFRQIYGKPNADDWTTTGFYRMRSNEALILYTPEYQPLALGNAFHEISHLVTAAHLGATPPWLNEGLAEYYETLDVVDDDVRFAKNPLHIQLLRRRGALSVDAMTTLSRKEWMQEDAQRRYASAWSFISFMLHSEDGRRTLQRVVQQAYSQRCAARPDLRKTLADYPGGLQALESDWVAWLRDNLRVEATAPIDQAL